MLNATADASASDSTNGEEVEMSDANEKRSVLARAFDILGCFGGGDPERSVADVCAATDLPPATVHRMLAALAEHGAIERASRGRYRLGTRLWRLGHDVPDIRTLRDSARPSLIDLHASTRLPVALAAANEGRLQVIDKIAGTSTVAIWDRLGAPALESHPAGQVLLAWGLNSDPSRITIPRGFDEFTWRQMLAQIRKVGFAHSPVGAAETSPIIWAAAPVFGEDQLVTSCVMIGGRRSQHPPIALGRLARTTAQDISASLRARTDEVAAGARA